MGSGPDPPALDVLELVWAARRRRVCRRLVAASAAFALAVVCLAVVAALFAVAFALTGHPYGQGSLRIPGAELGGEAGLGLGTAAAGGALDVGLRKPGVMAAVLQRARPGVAWPLVASGPEIRLVASRTLSTPDARGDGVQGTVLESLASSDSMALDYVVRVDELTTVELEAGRVHVSALDSATLVCNDATVFVEGTVYFKGLMHYLDSLVLQPTGEGRGAVAIKATNDETIGVAFGGAHSYTGTLYITEGPAEDDLGGETLFEIYHSIYSDMDETQHKTPLLSSHKGNTRIEGPIFGLEQLTLGTTHISETRIESDNNAEPLTISENVNIEGNTFVQGNITLGEDVFLSPTEFKNIVIEDTLLKLTGGLSIDNMGMYLVKGNDTVFTEKYGINITTDNIVTIELEGENVDKSITIRVPKLIKMAKLQGKMLSSGRVNITDNGTFQFTENLENNIDPLFTITSDVLYMPNLVSNVSEVSAFKTSAITIDSNKITSTEPFLRIQSNGILLSIPERLIVASRNGLTTLATESEQNNKHVLKLLHEKRDKTYEGLVFQAMLSSENIPLLELATTQNSGSANDSSDTITIFTGAEELITLSGSFQTTGLKITNKGVSRISSTNSEISNDQYTSFETLHINMPMELISKAKGFDIESFSIVSNTDNESSYEVLRIINSSIETMNSSIEFNTLSLDKGLNILSGKPNPAIHMTVGDITLNFNDNLRPSISSTTSKIVFQNPLYFIGDILKIGSLSLGDGSIVRESKGGQEASSFTIDANISNIKTVTINDYEIGPSSFNRINYPNAEEGQAFEKSQIPFTLYTNCLYLGKSLKFCPSDDILSCGTLDGSYMDIDSCFPDINIGKYILERSDITTISTHNMELGFENSIKISYQDGASKGTMIVEIPENFNIQKTGISITNPFYVNGSIYTSNEAMLIKGTEIATLHDDKPLIIAGDMNITTKTIIDSNILINPTYHISNNFMAQLYQYDNEHIDDEYIIHIGSFETVSNKYDGPIHINDDVKIEGGVLIGQIMWSTELPLQMNIFPELKSMDKFIPHYVYVISADGKASTLQFAADSLTLGKIVFSSASIDTEDPQSTMKIATNTKFLKGLSANSILTRHIEHVIELEDHTDELSLNSEVFKQSMYHINGLSEVDSIQIGHSISDHDTSTLFVQDMKFEDNIITSSGEMNLLNHTLIHGDDAVSVANMIMKYNTEEEVSISPAGQLIIQQQLDLEFSGNADFLIRDSQQFLDFITEVPLKFSTVSTGVIEIDEENVHLAPNSRESELVFGSLNSLLETKNLLILKKYDGRSDKMKYIDLDVSMGIAGIRLRYDIIQDDMLGSQNGIYDKLLISEMRSASGRINVDNPIRSEKSEEIGSAFVAPDILLRQLIFNPTDQVCASSEGINFGDLSLNCSDKLVFDAEDLNIDSDIKIKIRASDESADLSLYYENTGEDEVQKYILESSLYVIDIEPSNGENYMEFNSEKLVLNGIDMSEELIIQPDNESEFMAVKNLHIISYGTGDDKDKEIIISGENTNVIVSGGQEYSILSGKLSMYKELSPRRFTTSNILKLLPISLNSEMLNSNDYILDPLSTEYPGILLSSNGDEHVLHFNDNTARIECAECMFGTVLISTPGSVSGRQSLKIENSIFEYDTITDTVLFTPATDNLFEEKELVLLSDIEFGTGSLKLKIQVDDNSETDISYLTMSLSGTEYWRSLRVGPIAVRSQQDSSGDTKVPKITFNDIYFDEGGLISSSSIQIHGGLSLSEIITINQDGITAANPESDGTKLNIEDSLYLTSMTNSYIGKIRSTEASEIVIGKTKESETQESKFVSIHDDVIEFGSEIHLNRPLEVDAKELFVNKLCLSNNTLCITQEGIEITEGELRISPMLELTGLNIIDNDGNSETDYVYFDVKVGETTFIDKDKRLSFNMSENNTNTNLLVPTDIFDSFESLDVLNLKFEGASLSTQVNYLALDMNILVDSYVVIDGRNDEYKNPENVVNEICISVDETDPTNSRCINDQDLKTNLFTNEITFNRSFEYEIEEQIMDNQYTQLSLLTTSYDEATGLMLHTEKNIEFLFLKLYISELDKPIFTYGNGTEIFSVQDETLSIGQMNVDGHLIIDKESSTCSDINIKNKLIVGNEIEVDNTLNISLQNEIILETQAKIGGILWSIQEQGDDEGSIIKISTIESNDEGVSQQLEIFNMAFNSNSFVLSSLNIYGTLDLSEIYAYEHSKGIYVRNYSGRVSLINPVPDPDRPDAFVLGSTIDFTDKKLEGVGSISANSINGLEVEHADNKYSIFSGSLIVSDAFELTSSTLRFIHSGQDDNSFLGVKELDLDQISAGASLEALSTFLFASSNNEGSSLSLKALDIEEKEEFNITVYNNIVISDDYSQQINIVGATSLKIAGITLESDSLWIAEKLEENFSLSLNGLYFGRSYGDDVQILIASEYDYGLNIVPKLKLGTDCSLSSNNLTADTLQYTDSIYIEGVFSLTNDLIINGSLDIVADTVSFEDLSDPDTHNLIIGDIILNFTDESLILTRSQIESGEDSARFVLSDNLVASKFNTDSLHVIIGLMEIDDNDNDNENAGYELSDFLVASSDGSNTIIVSGDYEFDKVLLSKDIEGNIKINNLEIGVDTKLSTAIQNFNDLSFNISCEDNDETNRLLVELNITNSSHLSSLSAYTLSLENGGHYTTKSLKVGTYSAQGTTSESSVTQMNNVLSQNLITKQLVLTTFDVPTMRMFYDNVEEEILTIETISDTSVYGVESTNAYISIPEGEKIYIMTDISLNGTETQTYSVGTATNCTSNITTPNATARDLKFKSSSSNKPLIRIITSVGSEQLFCLGNSCETNQNNQLKIDADIYYIKIICSESCNIDGQEYNYDIDMSMLLNMNTFSGEKTVKMSTDSNDVCGKCEFTVNKDKGVITFKSNYKNFKLLLMDFNTGQARLKELMESMSTN